MQLWRQGGARVLLNEGSGQISALAVESADPAASQARAAALHSPALTDVSLPGVAAPDGTAVFFCGNGWLEDFPATGAPEDAGAGITGTDHVSLTQPFDNFDEAALFYRSVLGLQPELPTEFAAPFGLVRSRAVSNAARDVRISLNVALLRRGGWAPGVPEPQHLAFTSEDVLASARQMHERGAPLLRIPDNYYDDLDARLAPPPELLAALRKYSVLYDRDEGGEFLHFYTRVLGSRVFFEVVQRIGNYAYYGAANAPVRMAAHRRLRLAGG